MLTVLLGGARSGKSAAALRLARAADPNVCFIATSPRLDDDIDLAVRIEAHRAERPSAWRTVEAELDLTAALGEAGDAHTIVDCLTVWVGNMMHHGRSDAEIFDNSSHALAVARARTADTTVVTNEVGMGIVPADGMSRRYRDLLGRVNQDWVARSDLTHFMVAGRVLPLSNLADP
jgi:adenosyl cobinamide kinase/adenosyl cobinamide phosphate guanylyltransferase